MNTNTYYEIAFISIRVSNLDGIDLSRFQLFESICFFEPLVHITISRTKEIVLEDYNLILHKDITVAEFSDGRHGNIFYSKEGIPVACLLANPEWKDITIIFSEPYHIGNYSLVEHVFGMAFRSIIVYHSGLVLHSSAIQYKNRGIVFSAPSGTGKSTHTGLWKKHFGADIINDDTPAIIPYHNDIFVCGTPWSGSTDIFMNISVPIKAIVVLSQYHSNRIEKLGNSQIVAKLMPRFYFPYQNKKLINKALDNFNQIIHKVPVYELKCTPSVEATELVKSYFNL